MKASVIFLKLIFAVGVLSIPDNLHTLGKSPLSFNLATVAVLAC